MENPPLEEHLDELRNRIIFCLVSFLPLVGLGFWLAPILLKACENLAPTGTIFFQIKPGELLFVYIKLSFILALILFLPLLLQQIASFLAPGLKNKEKKLLYILFTGGPFLFLGGVSFAYFIALKPLLAFLLGFGVDLELVQPQYSLDYFVSLILGTLLLFGIVFQVPILLFGLAILDLISSAQLWQYWQYAVFISFLIAAIATPTPDPLNMLILGLAIGTLYFLSIGLLKLFGK